MGGELTFVLACTVSLDIFCVAFGYLRGFNFDDGRFRGIARANHLESANGLNDAVLIRDLLLGVEQFLVVGGHQDLVETRLFRGAEPRIGLRVRTEPLKTETPL